MLEESCTQPRTCCLLLAAALLPGLLLAGACSPAARLLLSARTWAVRTFQAPVINLLSPAALAATVPAQLPVQRRAKVPPGSMVPWGGHAGAGQLGESPTSRTAWRLQPWHRAGQCHSPPGTAGHRASGAQTTALASLAALGNAPRELPPLHHPSAEEELGFLLCSLK